MNRAETSKTHAIAIPKKNFKELTTRSFTMRIRGEIFQGFVVRRKDKFYAYQNLCRHLPITLDLNDEDFFTFDKTHLQCHMHGAVYEIETGLCIAGPCEGARLIQLELEEEETRLVVRVPENFAKK